MATFAYTKGFDRNGLREDIGVGVDSRAVRCGGCGGGVFVEEGPGVTAASTLVANAVDPRNRGHSSLFCLHFDIRGQEMEGNDIQQLSAASVQSLTLFLSTWFPRTQPLVRNFKEPSSI